MFDDEFDRRIRRLHRMALGVAVVQTVVIGGVIWFAGWGIVKLLTRFGVL